MSPGFLYFQGTISSKWRLARHILKNRPVSKRELTKIAKDRRVAKH
jgi:hypothetical protein